MLNFAFCLSWVDAPLVGGAEFLQDPFGSEGDEDFLALSPGGRRPHRGSFPFKRDVDGDGIVLGMLGHEDGGVTASWGGRECFSASCRCFSASCGSFHWSNKV